MAEPVNVLNLLETGIRAEGLRQRLIASNIANIQTPGYRRLDIRFEDLLSKAVTASDGDELAALEPEVYEPRNTPVRANGNDVQLEAEIGQLVKNTLRHSTYARLFRRKLDQIRAAAGVSG
jgi:flagellar basal-body rod protein FlgB